MMLFRLKHTVLILTCGVLFACKGFAQDSESFLPYARARVEAGEVCLVSGQPLSQEDVVYLVRGRRVPLKREYLAAFVADSSRYLALSKPKSALFHEHAAQARGIDLGWFLFGLYVLVALIFSGLSGYTAVSKGLNPIPHFFIGLIFSALGYLYVLARSRATQSSEVPRGLVKVRTTHEPVACGQCSYTNHPAAKVCLGCGAKLQPIVASEVEKRSK